MALSGWCAQPKMQCSGDEAGGRKARSERASAPRGEMEAAPSLHVEESWVERMLRVREALLTSLHFLPLQSVSSDTYFSELVGGENKGL